MPPLATLVEAVTTLLAFAGCGYYLVALWSARAYVRQLGAPLPDYSPGVTVLKPVKGLDPEMYATFASHCRQDYAGEYELIFAASSMEDPAIAAIEQLKREFPERTLQIVLCPEVLGANGKVSNLVQALPYARFDHILINDSDIFVSSRYLRHVMACFQSAESRIGMVTALYRGRARHTLSSKMEALGIATDFIPGVLTARRLERGIRFGLGSTLAVSRKALDASGGLAPLVDHLADDYELGARIAAQGFQIVLAPEVVETSVPAYTFSQFLSHQVRWARTVRDSRKLGYIGLVFSYGLAWAVLNLFAAGFSIESIALLSVTLATRSALALLMGVGILGDRRVLFNLWLLLPRDLIALAVWAWSFAGNTIEWRGEKFTLKNGKLTRVR